MLELIFYVLMVAPSATDNHVMNYAVPLGTYPEAEYCMDALNWIDEHQGNLPRHLWCMPVKITIGDGEQI